MSTYDQAGIFKAAATPRRGLGLVGQGGETASCGSGCTTTTNALLAGGIGFLLGGIAGFFFGTVTGVATTLAKDYTREELRSMSKAQLIKELGGRGP